MWYTVTVYIMWFSCCSDAQTSEKSQN